MILHSSFFSYFSKPQGNSPDIPNTLYLFWCQKY